MKNHYEILGLTKDATPEEIKKAYFEMAKKYHPDSNDQAELEKFHEVTRAYKTLSDQASRKTYDLTLNDTGGKKSFSTHIHEPQFARPQKREGYRDDELREFYKNRYKKAVLRVVLFSLFVGVVGGVFGLVLGGLFLFGFLAGVFVGFSFSINQNFKVKTFFKSDTAHKTFRLFSWLLFLGGLGYFVWLIVQDLF